MSWWAVGELFAACSIKDFQSFNAAVIGYRFSSQQTQPTALNQLIH